MFTAIGVVITGMAADKGKSIQYKNMPCYTHNRGIAQVTNGPLETGPTAPFMVEATHAGVLFNATLRSVPPLPPLDTTSYGLAHSVFIMLQTHGNMRCTISCTFLEINLTTSHAYTTTFSTHPLHYECLTKLLNPYFFETSFKFGEDVKLTLII